MVEMRAATSADLAGLTELISERDGHDYSEAHVRAVLAELDAERCLALVALEGERIVGSSNLFIHRWAHGERRYRVAYWANLLVAPEHRGRGLYRELTTAMFAAIEAHGLDFFLTSGRETAVVERHRRMGFVDVGTFQVRAKPVRPVRLLAAYKRLPARLLARVPDALYGAALSAMRRHPGCDLHETVAADGLAAYWSARAMSGADRVHRVWSDDELAWRLGANFDGVPYRVLMARAGERVAGLIYRRAERLGVAAMVVLDLFGDGLLARAAVRQVEARAWREDCDVVLALPTEPQVFTARSGYLPTPERYRLLVWSAAGVPDGLADARWRFTFLEHDAF